MHVRKPKRPRLSQFASRLLAQWRQLKLPLESESVIVAPGSGQQFMYAVGVVEIVAGLAVAVVPRIGAPLVAAWLVGIIVNLLTVDAPTYYDIALRDFGLLLGALALTRLAWSDQIARPAPVKIAMPVRSAVTIDA